MPATLVAFWQTVKNHYEFTRAGKRLEGLEKYNLACGNNVMKGWANALIFMALKKLSGGILLAGFQYALPALSMFLRNILSSILKD